MSQLVKLCTIPNRAELLRTLPAYGDSVAFTYTAPDDFVFGENSGAIIGTLSFNDSAVGVTPHSAVSLRATVDRWRLTALRLRLPDTAIPVARDGDALMFEALRIPAAFDEKPKIAPALPSPLPTLRKLQSAAKKRGGLILLPSGDYAAFVSETSAFIVQCDKKETRVYKAALVAGAWADALDASGNAIAQTFAAVDTFEIELIRS